MTDVAAVRRWARKEGILVGDRGRLACAVIAHYEAAQENSTVLRRDQVLRFEILANYLEPRFGNVYDHDEPPAWSRQLYHEVRTFLMRKLPKDVWKRFTDDTTLEGAERLSSLEDLVNDLVRQNDICELSLLIRNAAVAAVPTLDQLFNELGLTNAWPSAEEQWDVAVWLDARASEQDLQAMWQVHAGRPNRHGDGSLVDGYQLTVEMSPVELLAAWRACRPA
jgi:hypothetical protein